MEETKQKKKHPIRNTIIVLLVLGILGGGGYFGYIKYQEYQEEQAAATEYQEKVDEALKGVSEEDAAKLTDKQLKNLTNATSKAGQEQALNNYGIMADVNERYNTVGNYYGNYTHTIAEEDTQVNANEIKVVCTDGETRPLFAEVGSYFEGIVLYDRLYGGDTLAFENYYPYGEDMPDYYGYCGIDADKVKELIANYPTDENTVFKSYDLYWSKDNYGGNSVQIVGVNDENPDGEPKICCMG